MKNINIYIFIIIFHIFLFSNCKVNTDTPIANEEIVVNNNSPLWQSSGENSKVIIKLPLFKKVKLLNNYISNKRISVNIENNIKGWIDLKNISYQNDFQKIDNMDDIIISIPSGEKYKVEKEQVNDDKIAKLISINTISGDCFWITVHKFNRSLLNLIEYTKKVNNDLGYIKTPDSIEKRIQYKNFLTNYQLGYGAGPRLGNHF